MNLTLLLAECASATDGEPMTWWQALIVTAACVGFAIAAVVVAVLLGGPRR